MSSAARKIDHDVPEQVALVLPPMTSELQSIQHKILAGKPLTEREQAAVDARGEQLAAMPRDRRPLTAEEQKAAESAWNDEEGIARWAKWFDEQPEDFRQMIDEIGTSSRTRALR